MTALLAVPLGALAQPLPAPAPRGSVPADADPIAALLQAQAREHPEAALPVVVGLKLGESAERSRFVFELSDPLDVRVFALANPNRVVIEMPEVLWRMQEEERPTGRGAVKSYRYGLVRKGNSRFVIDLNKPVTIAPPRILPPEGGAAFRLVVDLSPASQAEFLARAGWPKDAGGANEAAALSPLARESGGRRVIVLDPGHGGIDPGTHGQRGLLEKDLVLSVAQVLRRRLEATGRYRVQLTRDGDVFIPLRERVNIARATRGDLFVSLHADSNDRRDIRGASVYTLSESASDREAASLAEKENMSDLIAGVNLANESGPVATILLDLVQRDTMNRSVRFAETLLRALPAATKIQPNAPRRSAGFAVLKAPDVPSVLVELGYLTNPEDEKEMMTEAWKNRVARAIASAIDAHFGPDVGLLPREAADR